MTYKNNSEEERRNKIRRFKAQKSKIVTAKEYEPSGKVLVFNSSKCDPDFPGKFGHVVKYDVIDPDTNVERAVHCSAISLLDAVEQKLAERQPGTDVKLKIWKEGNGNDTRYHADFAN